MDGPLNAGVERNGTGESDVRADVEVLSSTKLCWSTECCGVRNERDQR